MCVFVTPHNSICYFFGKGGGRTDKTKPQTLALTQSNSIHIHVSKPASELY